jgi:hypothetical protein
VHANRYAHMHASLHHHSSLSSPCRAVPMVAREPGITGQPSKQRWQHRWWSLRCRLALSSTVPPSALCPGNIQTACACTMPYDAHTNGKCTCPPPCSSCLLTREVPSSMPCPPSAWPCFQCYPYSLSSYCHLIPFLCHCLCP